MSASEMPTLAELDENPAFSPRLMRWGFGAMLAVILAISAFGFWRIELGNRALNEVVTHEQVAVELLYDMQLAARDRTFALFAAVHTADSATQARALQRFDAMGARFRSARDKLIALPLTPAERQLLGRQQAQIARMLPQQRHVIELLESGRRVDAEQWLVEHVVPQQNRVIDALAALLENAVSRTQAHAASARKAQHRTTLLFVAGGLAGMLMIWGAFILATRKMCVLVTRLARVSAHLHTSNQDLKFQKMALDEHNIVSVADPDGTIIGVNERFCAVSQYTREELIGSKHSLLKSGQHPDAFYDELWRTISSGKVWHGEICNRRKDGSLYWVNSTILPFVGDDGLTSRYVSVRTDITAIKEAQQVLQRSHAELEHLVQLRTRELAEREEVLHGITNAAQDAVIMLDPAGRITYWNPAAERIFGFTEAEALGEDLHDMIVPERYVERAQAGFAHFSRTGEGPAVGRTTTLQAKRRNGDEFPVDISLSAIQLHGQWNSVGIVRDATERVATEKRLQQLATTDPLTGLCNRRRFDEIFENEIHRASRFSTPLSLILFDIDHFKTVNDTFGHLAGDEVLSHIAGAVSGSIRTTDLLARWGGEEFILLLPGMKLADASGVAEKIRRLLEQQTFESVGHVTASFGVTAYLPGDTADELIRKLDLCLYDAKAAGRNRVETCRPAPSTLTG